MLTRPSDDIAARRTSLSISSRTATILFELVANASLNGI
jgi:hypothetical protein